MSFSKDLNRSRVLSVSHYKTMRPVVTYESEEGQAKLTPHTHQLNKLKVCMHSPISCSCSFFFSGFSPSLSLSLLDTDTQEKLTQLTHEGPQTRKCFLRKQRWDSILVIALCFLDRFFPLFIFIFQIVLQLLRSVQVLHTLCTYALLRLVTVGLIWRNDIPQTTVCEWNPSHSEYGSVKYPLGLEYSHLMACRKYSTACWYRRKASS